MKRFLSQINTFKINLLRVPNFRRSFTTEDKKSTNVSEEEQKEGQTSQAKGVKHIYKQKQENDQNIIYDEAHAYREGYEDGYYVKQKMSYVYYEYPGKSSESGGKSENKKPEIDEKNKESQDKKEDDQKQSSKQTESETKKDKK